MENNSLITTDNIKSKIYSVRGLQVMLDTDLAKLYDVETKRLNEQVRRNSERFPSEFMFQLTDSEFEILRSQFATSNIIPLELQNMAPNDPRGGRRYLPYVFTEQGVAMLSAVLKSDTAVKISIQIMSAFVAMRRFIASNAQIFQRLDNVERKQVIHDQKFEQVFDAIQSKDLKPEKGIFFDGQIFDAYKFVSDIIRTADKSIIIIDNYIDDSVLTLLNKRNKEVKVIIFTKEISKQLSLDLVKHNSQYPPIKITEFKQSHDRFIIIDNKEVYHFGASLKDLGKKWFAFSKFDKEAFSLLDKLGLK
ncbi:ORF6N domain-containing protein [Candidatus Woesearchaeota archaeon]|nr:ORF6N domain-containing protein [Candidatus Woesearchaeota archaeon]